MKRTKKQRLERAGWVVGDAGKLVVINVARGDRQEVPLTR